MKETVHKNHQGTHAESHFYKLSSELYSQMCYQFTWDCFLLGDGTDWGFEWGSCFFMTTIYCPPGAAFVPRPCTWPCGPLLTTNPWQSSASRADNADLKIRGFLYILTWELCRGWPQNSKCAWGGMPLLPSVLMSLLPLMSLATQTSCVPCRLLGKAMAPHRGVSAEHGIPPLVFSMYLYQFMDRF